MAMVKALADISPAALEVFSSRMPKRIEDALDFPVVSEMVLAAGEDKIKAYVEFELIKLSTLISVGGNLNNAQVIFIAEELIRTYPKETLADFKLCFQRGAIGQYGQIFRMDGIVLREWMTQYLDEKYQVVETQHNEIKQVKALPENAETLEMSEERKKEIDQYVADLSSGKKVRPMSHSDIQQEGKRKQNREEYTNGYSPGFVEMRDKLHRISSDFYQTKESFASFQLFQIGGHDIFAESQQDAELIYNKAKEEK